LLLLQQRPAAAAFAAAQRSACWQRTSDSAIAVATEALTEQLEACNGGHCGQLCCTAAATGTVVAITGCDSGAIHALRFLRNAMKAIKSLITLSLALAAASSFAQQAPQEWKYKTRQLERAEVEKLLAKPEKLLVVDVRRPDELTAKGSFPVYLNVQAKEVEQNLAFIPKDRVILTVSNHAHRAGAVGDLLTSKGYKVAGATGSEDYEAQGGKITRVTPPARPAAQAAPQ
jgi:rhodanese-related sulfurtransferase